MGAGGTRTGLSALLSTLREVTAFVDGSGVTAKFAGKSGRAAAQFGSDLPERFSLSMKHGQSITLISRELGVTFLWHNHPRYRTSGVALRC